MNKLTAKLWGLEELCSYLEEPGMRICILLLGPPLDQVPGADRLD
jgi:hypothetical protein